MFTAVAGFVILVTTLIDWIRSYKQIVLPTMNGDQIGCIFLITVVADLIALSMLLRFDVIG